MYEIYLACPVNSDCVPQRQRRLSPNDTPPMRYYLHLALAICGGFWRHADHSRKITCAKIGVPRGDSSGGVGYSLSPTTSSAENAAGPPKWTPVE